MSLNLTVVWLYFRNTSQLFTIVSWSATWYSVGQQFLVPHVQYKFYLYCPILFITYSGGNGGGCLGRNIEATKILLWWAWRSPFYLHLCFCNISNNVSLVYFETGSHFFWNWSDTEGSVHIRGVICIEVEERVRRVIKGGWTKLKWFNKTMAHDRWYTERKQLTKL